MPEILSANYREEILPEYRDTPVGLLLEYHNLGRALGSISAPQLLIGMCMDSRKALRIPNDFAFVLRTAGANMRDNEFRIAYAIAVGNVHTIVLIAHTDCGMAQLDKRRDDFINGLVRNAGWDRERAEQHFAESAPKFGIRDEVDFVLREADRLREIYPRILVAPLLYRVEDDLLYQLRGSARRAMTVDRGYVVRDARPDDRDAIRDLTLDAYAEYGKIMEPDSWAGLSAAVRAALASTDPMERIVADDDGTLIGSVLLYPAAARAYGDQSVEANSPELRLLAVARDARGRGVGRALVDECVRRARLSGATALGLHSSKSMVAAVQLYQRMGFERAPELDFHPPEAEVVWGYRLLL